MAGRNRFRNRDEVMRRLAALPKAMKAPVQAQGDIEARRLAGKVKAAAPVGSELERHPGELRDSVHDDKGKRELSWRIVIDAKDAKGRFIAPHVEFGHLTTNGQHVAPSPFAYPTMRIEAPGLRRRMAAAGRAGAKAAMGVYLT